MHYADETEDISIIEFLLGLGSNPNVKNIYGKSPLFTAIHLKNESAVELLLEHDSDVNSHDSRGTTPLEIAKVINNKKILELLVKYGAK